ncbi:hypothetical protein AgCh_000155 [Apium graveolens]
MAVKKLSVSLLAFTITYLRMPENQRCVLRELREETSTLRGIQMQLFHAVVVSGDEKYVRKEIISITPRLYDYLLANAREPEVLRELREETSTLRGIQMQLFHAVVVSGDEKYVRKEIISITPRLYDYLLANAREPEVLRELREETSTLRGIQMQVSPDQAQLLAMLVQVLGVERCIEVGVYMGYSSLAVALVLPESGRLVACERDEKALEVEKRYYDQVGVSHKVDVRHGLAADALKSMIQTGEGCSYDFAFIDADKRNYQEYFELLLQLVRVGGIIIIDNVLWHGKVANPLGSRYLVWASLIFDHHLGSHSGGPLVEYERRIAAGELVDGDICQVGTLKEIQRLYDELIESEMACLYDASEKELRDYIKAFMAVIFVGNNLMLGWAILCLYLRQAEQEKFHTLALDGVPVFGLYNRAAAYRFITLVDVMYENKAQIICAAEPAEGTPLQLFEKIVTISEARSMAPRGSRSWRNDDIDLCVDNELGFAKDRTISRLTEMNNSEYLEQHAELLAEAGHQQGVN